MTKQRKNIPVYCAAVICLAVSYFSVSTPSVQAVHCDELSGDAKDECESLEKKAKAYENIIDLKNKQQDTLSAQIESIDREQNYTKSILDKIRQENLDLSSQIENLERDIVEKAKEADLKKKMLSGLMQSCYEYDQRGIAGLAFIDEDTSMIFDQADYLEQSGAKVKDILADLQKARNDLLEDQQVLKEKKAEKEKKEAELADKKSDLDASEYQKQSLLVKTQGEEQKYRDLLANVEEQKKELFNFSEAENLDEITSSIKNYPSPKDNLASTSWYFSQKDPSWGNTKIGNSTSLMKDYGCAVTSVAMVFKKNGASITPGKMAKQKIFYYDLIKWPSTWPPGIALTSSVGHGNISWSTIDRQIGKNNPVIVYIKKTNGRGGHYVVVTGKDKKDYIVHDPYFGPNLYLGTSKALVGKIGVDSKVVVDQMIVYN